MSRDNLEEPREGWELKLGLGRDGLGAVPEIAATLGRTDSTVRKMHLGPLLAHGTLQRLRPEQAHRTVRKTS